LVLRVLLFFLTLCFFLPGMATYWQQMQQAVDIPNPYKTLGIPRAAKVDEIRRSYKQKVLETHPDKLPQTASEEEKRLALDLFHQIQEAFRVLNSPNTRRAYDIHHRPLPEETPIQPDPKASTPSGTTTSLVPKPVPKPTPAPIPARASTPPRANKFTPCLTDRPHSGTLVALEELEEAHELQMKERSEWANRSEERRLDKLKAYILSEEIQSLGQKQAALVEKMTQDLFALTPEWEIRRMKARAYKASRPNARTH